MGNSTKIQEGMIYVFHDQGRPKEFFFFQAMFKNELADKTVPLAIVYRKIAIVVDEASMMERQGKRYIQQIEWLHVFHNQNDMPVKRYMHYDGSTRGNCIMKVMVEP